MIGRADQRAGLGEPLARAREVGQVADLPRRVVHARHALVGTGHARLLEQAEMVVVGGSGDLQEGRVRIASLDLEAHDVAVEAHAALDVSDPQDQVL